MDGVRDGTIDVPNMSNGGDGAVSPSGAGAGAGVSSPPRRASVYSCRRWREADQRTV
ncbi:Uncharacterized protein DAT39_018235 [Clarias magur]|uniref:Uncharacterized protein n=1 Tax=Clarias magur TaxID=1594786 RepID=A0A8J4T9E9_CLAMG|nr:Uncharacterized protein DAT39_018235 [Clarias magur]